MSQLSIKQGAHSNLFQTWFNGLRGLDAGVDPTSPPAQKEGQLIRSLVLDRITMLRCDDELSKPESHQHHLRNVLCFLHREGLIVSAALATPESPTSAVAAFAPTSDRFISANQNRYALAAGLAVVAFGLSIYMHGSQREEDDNKNEMVMRGDELPQRLVISSSLVKPQAQKIITILAESSLVYELTTSSDAVQIRAKVPYGHPARQELKVLQIEVPLHGRLNVVVTSVK